MAAGPKARILIVEDENLIVMALTDIVEMMGHEVCGAAATADQAIRKAEALSPDVVLMDVRLRGSDGITAAQIIHHRLSIPVVFMTGSREPETMRRIQAIPGADVLIKPVSPAAVQKAIAARLP